MKVIGKDAEFRYILSIAEKLAKEKRPVVLVGETGTGKSFLANFIHARGNNAGEPFLEWNASTVPESLIEAEIFGVEKGVATGVVSRTGILEAAQKGILSISGLEELPIHAQALFLRLVESGEFEKIGGQRKTRFEGRLIVSFQQSPKQLVKEGKLRSDLLYRLDVFQIELPPLRERKGDIPVFAEEFLKRESTKRKREAQGLSEELKKTLENYNWPGNVRELENLVSYLANSEKTTIEIGDLPPHYLISKSAPLERALSERMSLEELKNMYVEAILLKVGGKKTAAAKWLKISRKTLWEHLKEKKE